MDALHVRPRFRLAPLLEWAVAALLLTVAFWLGTRADEVMRASPVASPEQQAVAGESEVSVPPAVPARAVSVPVLPFKDGKELRVGESLAAVAQRLGRAAELGVQEIDRGRFGERLTRFYEYAGARFILVFEPLQVDGEARLAAIYLR